MQNQRLPLLLLLSIYIFSPTIFFWVSNPDGAWYRPYIIWVIFILAAYLYQRQNRHDDI